MKKKPEDKTIPHAETGERLKYEPPTISFTEIEVEEALMGMCKSGGVPIGPMTCNTCSGIGS